MLLQRLREYADAHREDALPPFHARKPVRWVLELDADGGLRYETLRDLADPGERDQRFGQHHVVPAASRTVAVAPMVGVETPEYVFGWEHEDANPQRVPKLHAAFTALVERWADDEAAAGYEDGPAQALRRFYERGEHERVVPPDGWGRTELIAFRVADRFAHQHPFTGQFWRQVAEERKGSGRRGLCLVCGENRMLLNTMPQQVQRKWVPGATQSASLVSINSAVHGFELTQFLTHTPICTDCGNAVMESLTAVLSGPHSVAYAGQNARLAWWVTGEGDLEWDLFDTPDAESVNRFIGSVKRGERPPGEEFSKLCAVTVGGNAARVMVRDWIEQPLPEVQKRIVAWFEDHRIVDVWTGEKTYVGVHRLALAAGRWVPGRNGGHGSYVTLGGSGENRPREILHALVRAALLGETLPPRLLSHLVQRVRTDKRLDTPRAALLRLALRRHPTTIRPERYMSSLNPDNDGDPAYLCGRVFAVLQDLQDTVAYLRGDKVPNVTFTDRYFSRAVTSPRVALVAGRRDARAWLKTIRGRRPSWAAAKEQKLDELFAAIDAAGGMPHGAVLPQQAAFILGYHQQRAQDRADRPEKNKNSSPDSPEQPSHDDEGARQ